MQSDYMDLKFILNLEKFQRLQDGIADMTGLAVLTVDYKGIPVTRHSRSCGFCRKIRQIPEFADLCKKCDSRGGLEAARIKQPYIYLCHMGLVDFAIPIIAEDKYLGAVMAGQVFTGKHIQETSLERIYSARPVNGILKRNEEIRRMYDEIPVMSFEEIRGIAGFISNLCDYIIGESKIRAELYEDCSRLESDAGTLVSTGRKNIDTRVITYYKDNYEGSRVLKPAVDYIRNHPMEKIYIKNMAEQCNLSVSYFSRLFKKEMKTSFSAYINNVKIDAARELLEITKLQISEIAYNLGYEDCGYFIRIFKNRVGITPAAYRKSHRGSH